MSGVFLFVFFFVLSGYCYVAEYCMICHAMKEKANWGPAPTLKAQVNLHINTVQLGPLMLFAVIFCLK